MGATKKEAGAQENAKNVQCKSNDHQMINKKRLESVAGDSPALPVNFGIKEGMLEMVAGEGSALGRGTYAPNRPLTDRRSPL